MLVVDASALVEVLTTDPSAAPALANRIHEAEWTSAPDLLDYEVMKVLRKLVLRDEIDEEIAEEARHTLRALRISRHPMTDRLSERVWALRRNITAYDGAYVALAEELGLPLITADGRLAASARGLTTAEIETYTPS